MIVKSSEPSGICSSCKTAPVCTYTKDLRRPALQCEDFEGYEPGQKKITFSTAPLGIDRQCGADPEKIDWNKHKGLCGICDDRDTCSFTRPEGGVWHCEEYR